MEWSTSGVLPKEGATPPKGKFRVYVSGKDDNGKWIKKAYLVECEPPKRKNPTEEQLKKHLKKQRDKLLVEAEKWRKELNAELEEEIKRGKSATQARKGTVADYVDSYIDELEQGKRVERSTIMGYRTAAKYIREAFGEVVVCELDRESVAQWTTALSSRGLSSSTVGKAFRLLRQAMKNAVARHVIKENPTDTVKPPKREKTNEGINALPAEGRSKLLNALDSMESTPATIAARIALYTGLREGEICGLQWRDIDFASGVIWIRRSIGRGEGGCYPKETKTGRARDVALPPSLSAYLQDLKAERNAASGKTLKPTDYVLSIPGEGYVQPPYLGRTWAALSKALGLKGTENRNVTFHDLRHTWATLAVAGGVDIKTVSSNLGHSNAAMTLNIYASSDPDAKRRAAELTELNMLPKAGEVIHLHTGTEG